MTLKNHLSELSERAKAFSVENLINEGSNGEREEIKYGNQMQTSNGITTELCGSDLWRKFSDIGTEMIVTKAGRRMFPTLKVRFHGLSMSTIYIVYMDIIPVGDARYRYIYHSSQWMVAGAAETHSENNLYIHPDSPATGQLWTSQGHISFDKIKLTNNKRPIMMGQISLQSMHKYQPRIHILQVPISDNLRLNTPNQILDYVRWNGKRAESFTFDDTTFITVTAYQNQEITKLKIQSNPFAKGFRQPAKLRETRGSRMMPDQGCSQSVGGCHHPSGIPNWEGDSEVVSSEKPQKIPLRFVIPPDEMRGMGKKPNGESVNFFSHRL